MKPLICEKFKRNDNQNVELWEYIVIPDNNGSY